MCCSTITMCIKCREKFTNPLAQINLIDDDYGIAFDLLFYATNIKKEVSSVLTPFFFLKKVWKKKSHNMLYLTLDPRFKSFHLVSSFIGHEKNVSIIEKYDRWSLYLLLLKYYHYLHPIVESEIGCANQIIYENPNLDFF